MERFLIIFITFIVVLIAIYFFIYKQRNRYNDKKKVLNKIKKFYEELYEMKNNYINYTKYDRLKNKYTKTYYDAFEFKNDSSIRDFIDYFSNLKVKLDKINDEYIKTEVKNNREFFDKVYKVPIDEEKRNIIVADDDSSLILGGAGTGKTTTMISKVRYLINKRNVNPKDILILTFNKNEVDILTKELGSDVKITTVIDLSKEITGATNINNHLIDKVIDKYFNENVRKNPDLVNKFVSLLSLYVHIPNIKEEKNLGEKYSFEGGFDFESLKSKVNKIKNPLEYKEEIINDYEELLIANYLYLNNINYVYEKKYEVDVCDKYGKKYRPDFYLPDYKLYIECFNINEDGRAPQYSKDAEKKYLDNIKFIRKLHKDHKTNFFEIDAYEVRKGSVFKEIRKAIKDYDMYVSLPDLDACFEALIKDDSAEINSLKELIKKFIFMYKANDLHSKFVEYKNKAKSSNNSRDILLLEFIEDTYRLYKSELLSNNVLDYNDLVKLAIENVDIKKVRYLVIDEYQDMTYLSLELIKKIREMNVCKLICYADDWQSVNKENGSDVDLTIRFRKYFDNSKVFLLNKTFRNSEDLIDLAGNFIMSNSSQIKKGLNSRKKCYRPIKLYYYDKNYNYNVVKKAVDELIKNGCVNIAIIGRNKEDIKNISKYSESMTLPYNLSRIFDANVVFTTVYESKGAEYDGTVLINLTNDITGFPNKMSDDPVLNYVSLSKSNMLYEEERRLFYVALTRTKTCSILLVPYVNESCFIDEIKNNSSSQIEEIFTNKNLNKLNPTCPECQKGRLVIMTNKQGIPFVGCSNHPRCKFSRKELEIVTNTKRCPECDGFLVKNGDEYRCTNHPKCKYKEKI